MQTHTDIHQISAALSPITLLSDNLSLEKYGRDRTHFTPAAPLAIVLPESIEQIQKIIKYAAEHNIAVTPSGGRTGLTGAATASKGELVIAMDKMNKITQINTIERTVVCEAGVILQELHEYTEENGLFYPVSLAAKGSCQIGGNIATNAGGINVIHYGCTRQWVAGLKVVTGTGELLELNTSGLMKDNTGYALHELFIGSEGTLGIIAEATLRLTRQPHQLQVIVLGHESLDDVIHTLKIFQKSTDLTAFETFDQLALDKVIQQQNIPRPFDTNTPFYSLIEFEYDNELTEERIMSAFEICMENGWVMDGVLSQNESQREQLWRCREDISETLSHETPYKYDVSVPVTKIPEFYKKATQLLKKQITQLTSVWFGHVGDGNLHLNILQPKGMKTSLFQQICEKINPELFALLQQMHGSISAEHGIGLLKKPYLHFSRTESEIALMRQIKYVFDPKGIMNPGKIFD